MSESLETVRYDMQAEQKSLNAAAREECLRIVFGEDEDDDDENEDEDEDE